MCKALSQFVGSILVNSHIARILLAPSCALTVIPVPNTFLRGDNFSIAICSWLS
jgi:hypothetical protein